VCPIGGHLGPPPLVHDLRGGRVLRFVQEPARAVFIMIGAEPPTDWLPDEIRRDPRGYLMTGDDAGRSSSDRSTGTSPNCPTQAPTHEGAHDTMNLPAELSTTRRALHAVAELLIAGPQYEAVGDIRLAARPGGFGGRAGPTPSAVSGTDLITPTDRFPLGGSVNDLARRAGITPRALRDVYTGGPDFSLEEPTEVTSSAAEVLLRAFTDGDAALRSLDPGQMPILWPEHFDIGISAAEVNYGVSPGDALIGEPYAYVGPWQVPTGAFWNQPFGAARPLSRLPSPQAILEFFLEGRNVATGDTTGNEPMPQT